MHFLLRLCACVGVFFKTHWIAALDLVELVKGARESEEECPKVSASRPVTVPCCFFYKRSDASIINLSNLMLPPPNLKKNKRDRHNRIALHSNWISRPFDLEKIRADDVTLFRLIEIEWHVFITCAVSCAPCFACSPKMRRRHVQGSWNETMTTSSKESAAKQKRCATSEITINEKEKCRPIPTFILFLSFFFFLRRI